MTDRASTMQALLGARVVPVVVLEELDDGGARGGGARWPAACGGRGHLPHRGRGRRDPGASPPRRTCSSAPARCVRPEQVDEAVEAGARFIVTPGLQRRAVVARCRELGVPVLPGVATATEIDAALDARPRRGQVLPGRAARRRSPCCRRWPRPFPAVRFVPTGGISAGERCRDYLALPSVLAVGGSWMVAPDLIAARRLGRDHPPDAPRRSRSPQGWRRERGSTIRPRGRVPLRPRLARRGDAAARPRRGPDPHRPRVPGLGGRRRVQRGPRAAPLLRPAHRASSPRSPTTRSAGCSRTSILQGGVDTALDPLGAVRRHRPDGPQRTQLHRARLRRARRASASPTGATPRPASCARATSTGTTSSARSACAGCTPAASSPRCPRPRRRSSSRRSMPRPSGTAPSSRTT